MVRFFVNSHYKYTIKKTIYYILVLVFFLLLYACSQEKSVDDSSNKIEWLSFEEAEERKDGELKRKLGVVFLRGDTIILISPAQ